MTFLTVKPKNDKLIVRMPEKGNQKLPVYGAKVPNNSYWNHRLNDGDVIKITDKEFNTAKQKKQKKAEKTESVQKKSESKNNLTDSEK